MRLYYIDESEGPPLLRPLRPGGRWRTLERAVRRHPCLASGAARAVRHPPIQGASRLRPVGGEGKAGEERRYQRAGHPKAGVEVFLSGLRKLEDAARNIGGIEVINVCLHKPESRRYEQASLDRLLNRINRSVASANRHAFLIFDEGKEEMITGLYRRLKVRNHVPSRYDLWEDGEKTRNIPIEQVIGGPAFRSSAEDYLLQMADFVAHALLKQVESPVPRVENHGIDGAFSILDRALNRQASRRAPQGVVRR